MGINFDGVNPESKAKFEKILADGKITAEELKGLTEAEKEALAKGLGGVRLPETGEIKVSEPDVPKEKPGFLGKIWNGVKDFASTTTGKVVIGGAATVAALGLTAATFGLGAATLVGAAGALLTLTSCSPLVEAEQNVYVDTESLVALLQKQEANEQKRHDDIMDVLNALLAQGKTIESLVKELSNMGVKLDRIVDLLVVNNTDNAKIIELLTDLGKSNAEIYSAIGDVKMEQSQQTELLKQLVGNDDIKVKYLDTILNEIRNGNKLQANTQDILNQILVKLDSLDNGDSASAEILNQILAKLTQFAKDQADMDTQTHDLLKTIINNQEKYGDDIKQVLSDILAKLDSMDKADKERFEYIVPILEALGTQGTDILNAIKNGNKITQSQLNAIIRNQRLNATQLESLKKLIMVNNEIAQGTQDAVKDLKSQMDANQKAILDKISAGNATLGEIKTILGDIKTGVANNSIKLGDIKTFMNIIGSTLEKLLTEVKGIRVETQQGILAILAKIPDGCDCKPTDLSAIIDLLNKLLDEVQKDPADNTDSTPDDGKGDHEGILNDLDKYFQ